MEDTVVHRRPYTNDVSDEKWAFVAPYLTLMRLDASQRTHDLREVFNAVRWMVRSGSPWSYLPYNFSPWEAVYQQTRRWIDAGVFKDMTNDQLALLRWSEGRDPEPRAVIFDSTTRQSTPESGGRGGYDGDKRKQGSKMHIAVDKLGNLLALHVTPANAQDRAQVAVLFEAVQEETGETVDVAYVDQDYTGAAARAAAAEHGIDLIVVKLEAANGASAVGGGAFACLGDALTAIGQRLRTVARGGPRAVFPGLCPSYAPTSPPLRRSKFITGPSRK